MNEVEFRRLTPYEKEMLMHQLAIRKSLNNLVKLILKNRDFDNQEPGKAGADSPAGTSKDSADICKPAPKRLNKDDKGD